MRSSSAAVLVAAMKTLTRLEETLNDERIHSDNQNDWDDECYDRVECVDDPHRLVIVGVQSALAV